MSGIIDIARSSLSAYRTALTTVSENIANVNTEGYSRRDVTTAEIPGSQTSAYTMAGLGNGVEVTDIRRNYDTLIANRLRAANGDVGAGTQELDGASQIESILSPDGGGVEQAVNDFFSALGTLASAPNTSAVRQAVLEKGKALASAISGAAMQLSQLRADTISASGVAADDLNGILQQLDTVNQRLPALAASSGAADPLLDTRDALLDKLSGMVKMTSTLDAYGRVTVKLGEADGPTLIDANGPASVSVASASTPIGLTVLRGASTLNAWLADAGSLGGYSRVVGAVDDTLAELSAFARRMAGDMNAVNRGGVDQNGKAGGDLFRMQGWTVAAGAINQGHVQASVAASTDTPYAGTVQLTYDAAAGLWHASDATTGASLGQGAGQIALPGMTVTLSGQPMNGDRLTLIPRNGNAADMVFVPGDPALIAAASASIVTASASNTGTATLAMTAVATSGTTTNLLTSKLTGSGSAADATSLLQSGVVGVVPAGTKSLSLASLGLQAMADIPLTAAQLSSASSLRIGLTQGVVRFSLSPLPASFSSVADLAKALNAGQIKDAQGRSLADLGMRAAGQEGQLTLSLASGDFATGTGIIGTSLNLKATTTPAEPAGGTIQIFTRDGRQVSGTPLTAAEASKLLTTANGFNATASYRADYLNGATGTAYRGTTLTQGLSGGLPALDLPPSSSPLTWNSATSAGPAASATRAVTVMAPPSANVTVPLGRGASAAEAARALMAATPGLAADASTAVEIDAPADGTLQFDLTGDNLTPLHISGLVQGGRMDGVAQAINAASASTGIRAELSPDGGRLLLVQDAGADISLTGLSHSAGSPVTLRQTDVQGQAMAGMSATLGGTDGANSLRVTGTVHLSASSAFAIRLPGHGRIASTPDAALGGLVSRESSAAGAAISLGFTFDPEIDGAGTSADGTTPSASATQYSVTLGGVSVTLDPAASGVTDAAGVSAGLAKALRGQGPVPQLSGAPVATLPRDGTSLLVSVDGQSYSLTMQSGAVVVDGPEPGRLSASFGSDGRLTLSLPDGTTDGASIGLPSGSASALAAFGFGASGAISQRLTGRAVDPASLPPGGTVVSFMVGGQRQDVTVTAQGSTVRATPAAGFPGTVSVDPTTGALTVNVPASAGAVSVVPPGGAGLQSLGASISVVDGKLLAQSTDGSPLQIAADAQSLAQSRVSLTDLPPEDLIVVMTGTGNLRLAGDVTPGDPPSTTPKLTLRVNDAATGAVEMLDSVTGQSIASGFLDANGSATLAGYSISLGGQAATGDSFTLAPNTTGLGDATNADRMQALRTRDPLTGRGGFSDILSAIQSESGSRVNAATTRQTTAESAQTALSKAKAGVSAVDLDTEAAKLVQMQQGYQASAQVLSVAKDLFDTLLHSL